jgi:hypothetical protein
MAQPNDPWAARPIDRAQTNSPMPPAMPPTRAGAARPGLESGDGMSPTDAEGGDVPVAALPPRQYMDLPPEVVERETGGASLDLDAMLGLPAPADEGAGENTADEGALPPDPFRIDPIPGPNSPPRGGLTAGGQMPLHAPGTKALDGVGPGPRAAPPPAPTPGGPMTVIAGMPVSGDGSLEHPLELPWGVLVSAARSYNPRLGKTDMPQWAATVDGKYVRMSGFAFLPMFASQTDEVLVMLNQWDGCCIGVPPTPYDSIEVKLEEPTTLGGRRMNYVSVVGQLDVDPYEVRGWLISLYVMDGAALELATN